MGHYVTQPPEVVNLETMDAKSTYYEFHFEPEIGHQDKPVYIFRAHSLAVMYYKLTFSKWTNLLRDDYVLSQIKQVQGNRSIVI